MKKLIACILLTLTANVLAADTTSVRIVNESTKINVDRAVVEYESQKLPFFYTHNDSGSTVGKTLLKEIEVVNGSVEFPKSDVRGQCNYLPTSINFHANNPHGWPTVYGHLTLVSARNMNIYEGEYYDLDQLLGVTSSHLYVNGKNTIMTRFPATASLGMTTIPSLFM